MHKFRNSKDYRATIQYEMPQAKQDLFQPKLHFVPTFVTFVESCCLKTWMCPNYQKLINAEPQINFPRKIPSSEISYIHHMTQSD